MAIKFSNWVKQTAGLIRAHPFVSWGIVFFVWLIDFGSTFFAVGLNPGVFFEANLIAAYFMGWGMHGWLIWASVVAIMIFFMLRSPYWFMKLSLYRHKGKLSKKKMASIVTIYNYFQIAFLILPIISESAVIGNNLGMLIPYYLI